MFLGCSFMHQFYSVSLGQNANERICENVYLSLKKAASFKTQNIQTDIHAMQ